MKNCLFFGESFREMTPYAYWFGPMCHPGGYGCHNREIVKRLKNYNIKVRTLFPRKYKVYKGLGYQSFYPLTYTKIPLNVTPLYIACTPPPAAIYFRGYKILYTTLETKTVHRGYLNRCKFFDEVWVPCSQNYNVLRPVLPKEIPIFVMPEGVDFNQFNLSDPQCDYEGPDVFKFFFSSDWSFRKGVQYLVPAFLEEFSGDEKVALIIHSRYKNRSDVKSKDTLKREFRNYFRSVGKENVPQIYVCSETIPESAVPIPYKMCDCYVIPTLGEGWNLTAIQAMACGKPVITTGYGGHLDFMNKKNSFLIKVDKFDTMDQYVNLEVDFYKLQLFAYPSVKHLRKLMRYAFTHQDQIKKIGLKGYQTVRKNFTWDLAAEKVAHRIHDLWGQKNGG